MNDIAGIHSITDFNKTGFANGINSLNSQSNQRSDININGDKDLSFSAYLISAVNQVNSLQIESQTLGNELAAGRTDSIHQVMIAGEKADIALQFTMQIRNKILDAYNEIMRMQI